MGHRPGLFKKPRSIFPVPRENAQPPRRGDARSNPLKPKGEHLSQYVAVLHWQTQAAGETGSVVAYIVICAVVPTLAEVRSLIIELIMLRAVVLGSICAVLIVGDVVVCRVVLSANLILGLAIEVMSRPVVSSLPADHSRLVAHIHAVVMWSVIVPANFDLSMMLRQMMRPEVRGRYVTEKLAALERLHVQRPSS